MKKIGVLLSFLFCFLVVSPLAAQDAVPADILGRTILMRTSVEQGTAFAIDYHGKLYLVTARHVVAGLRVENPTIQVRRNGQWIDLRPKKILFPSSDQVDIAILKTDENITRPYSVALSMKGEKGGPTMGQQVWFLGYPFIEGLSSHFVNGEAPFIKRGTMSAIDSTNPDAVVLYIDGFNNKGFSGGPIVFWDFTDHVYKIVGVVQGYKNDNAEALINGQKVDTNVLVNSGILVGYSIQHAIDAIEKDEAQKK